MRNTTLNSGVFYQVLKPFLSMSVAVNKIQTSWHSSEVGSPIMHECQCWIDQNGTVIHGRGQKWKIPQPSSIQINTGSPPDQDFSCRCSRLDDTLEGNGIPINQRQKNSVLHLFKCYDHSYTSTPSVNSALSWIILPWSSTGGLIS